MARSSKNVINLNNEKSATRLYTEHLSTSNSTQILDFYRCHNSWGEMERVSATEIALKQVRCFLGYQVITGNERADSLAKEACAHEHPSTLGAIVNAKVFLKEGYQEEPTAYCTIYAPIR